MTAAHKAALAEGRHDASIVRDYLTQLRDHQPKRGRQRTEARVRAQLAEVVAELESGEVDPMRELKLTQQQLSLEVELLSMTTEVDMTDSTAQFVAVAARWAERTGVSYAAFRKVGVDPKVLREAGITR